jgi:hypothetical protein
MDLTNEEKISIINQHIRSSLVNSFNLQVSLIEENANPTPNQETIDALNGQLSIETAKQEALQNEIASLS